MLTTCLIPAEGLEGGECREEESGEVYFTLKDLGIGPSHYRNLGHFEKVTFKLKLTDLSEEELEILEGYLEHVAATLEGKRSSEEQDDSDPTKTERSGSVLQSTPFATALESVTGIILRSAEIVDEQQMQEELMHRRIMRHTSNQNCVGSDARR